MAKDKAEKNPKKHLHKIIHTFAHDGSASHEHVYKKDKDSHEEEPPRFMGTSQNVDDLMQHDQDHAGPMMQGADQGGAPADGGDGGDGAPDAGAPDEGEAPAQ